MAESQTCLYLGGQTEIRAECLTVRDDFVDEQHKGFQSVLRDVYPVLCSASPAHKRTLSLTFNIT